MFHLKPLLASTTLAAMICAAPILAQAPASSAAADAAAFGEREGAVAMDLSPDGTKVVYVGPGPGRISAVFVADLTTGEAKPIIKSDANPESLEWCGFVSSRRIACRYSATLQQDIDLVGYGRMIALDIDGSNVKELGQRASAYDLRLRQFDGSIIDWLPGGNETVLMTRDFIPEAGKTGSNIVRDKNGLGVVRINTRTLKIDPVELPSTIASNFMSDGRGNVRVMAINERTPEGRLTGRTRYSYRTVDSREWQRLVDFQEDEFVPLAIDATIDSLYALKKLNGRYALYRIKLDSSLTAELVASNARVDIDDVIRLGNGQRVIGYTYVDDRRKTVYFDSEIKALTASIARASKAPMVTLVTASDDGQKLLLFAGADNDPGRYYLHDKAKRSLGEVLAVRPTLARRQLAPVKPVTYAGSDRVSIPAYLTLPPGSSGKGLPAVVLPHGGPSARDDGGFDWLAQFLAARGYAVIQPNYRGSAGFGDAWLVENGFKSWRTSIGDVTAAAHWLRAQGIADPKRIAIVGWSYGGYAALQAAAMEPALFRSVVAIAPVTDLDALKRDFRNFTSSRAIDQFIGSGPHISEGSPARRAAGINVPVLLVHGDLDTNVNFGHSKRMDAALRSAGKSSDFLQFKGLDHQIEDSAARTEMLSRIAALLERTIGR